MFMQDEEKKWWWYKCEVCEAETEKRANHESAEGLEGWHAERYTDSHICPKCQMEGGNE